MILEEKLKSGFSEQQAVQEAQRWKEQIQQGVQDNCQRINLQVISYWATHQEEAKQHSPHRPVHDVFGYDAAYAPSEQGLPNLEREIVRVGLRKAPTAFD